MGANDMSKTTGYFWGNSSADKPSDWEGDPHYFPVAIDLASDLLMGDITQGKDEFIARLETDEFAVNDTGTALYWRETGKVYPLEETK
jgi:hypothetical protein